MRKIEQEMVAAVHARKNWSMDNTRVEFVHPGSGNLGRVTLHGHRIASIDSRGNLEPDRQTFREWPTMTTASRLRALGVNASIRNGKACIDGVPV